MKAVFLVIDYVPHQTLTIRKLTEDYGFAIQAYHVGQYNKSIPVIENFTTIQYESLKKQDILANILNFQPDIVVVAGWMISDFMWIAKKLRNQINIPIVSYSDTQYYGTFRQKINCLISPFYVRRAFSHIWVSGLYQFEYARRLGFNKKNIILNSLCADVDLFEKVDIEAKREKYPKNFLYIGRFSPEKGLDILVDAWNNIPNKKDWTLTLIGDGVLKETFKGNTSIIVKDFMGQQDLLNEIQNSGFFILPSLIEPWALVIHEAAIAGLPIICTNVCGTAPHFVIDDYNGFKVDENNSKQLQHVIEKVIEMPNEKLIDFSLKSRELGKQINSETSIKNLLQLIKI